jgi:hypothetical protein
MSSGRRSPKLPCATFQTLRCEVYGEKSSQFRGHPQGPGFKTENLFGGLINEEEIQGDCCFWQIKRWGLLESCRDAIAGSGNEMLTVLR